MAYDTLNDEQKTAFDFLLRGDNVALLGPAGVGKSYLLSVIDSEFPGMSRRLELAQDAESRTSHKLPRIQMCALTGCAALLLGHKAKTLHSWAGIGLGKGTVQELYTKIRRNRKVLQHWLLTDLLVIDEVSMLTAELLDKLNELGKKIRGSRSAFGGLQVLLVGDFFQLPPVNRSDEPTRFAFESSAWKEGISVCIELTQIQRQKEAGFQTIMKEARMGQLSMESCAILRAREGLDWRKNKIKPTLLFPRRAEVELINESNLKALKGKRETYKARLAYDGKMPAGFVESDEGFQQALTRFDTDAAYTVQLELVLDSQVMLIANVDPGAGLVNGSRGVLVGFCAATSLPIVEFVNGIRRIIGTHSWPIEDYPFVSRTQIPLRLAWAITTHKCISSDTLLSIPNHGLISIQELEMKNQRQGEVSCPANMIVSGASENKTIIEVYKGFVEDGIKLETSFGYEITGSNRHPLLTYNKEMHIFEWKKIPEINVNDYIVLKKGAKVEGSYYQISNLAITCTYKKQITVPSYIDERFGYLMGVFLGDGSISKTTYRFDLISMDLDIINRCQTILKDVFDIYVELHECKDTKTQAWRIFFHSKQFIELFEHIGYKFDKANKKEIPHTILKSPLSVQKMMIQGLYDTDGGVSRSVINFTTTSHSMGKQLQEIMLNMGILLSKHTLHEEDTTKHHSKAYRLNMSGKSAVLFNKLIGFGCERKKLQSEMLFVTKKTARKDSKSQAFELPNGNVLIEKLRDEMHNGLKRLNTTTQISVDGRKLLSGLITKSQKLRCESIGVIIESINNIEQYPTGKFLKYIYDSGIIIDTIHKKDIIPNIQMYDIGVTPLNSSGYLPDGHDFIAAGFVNHNCQGSSLDCALVDIGSGNFEYGQAYVALSRARTLEGLFVHDFDPAAFRAHPTVKTFYKGLAETQASPHPSTDVKMGTQMSKEERDTIRRLAGTVPEVDVKEVRVEKSRAVVAVNVVKEDVEPGSP